jgi:hypothetical protein
LVRVKGARGAKPGDLVRVKVVSSSEHDLHAVAAPI